MTIEQIIAKTKKPVTKDEIKSKLIELGISDLEMLIVHCSLSSFGWVVGGAQAVIEAIYEATNYQATIIMPSQSTDNSNPEEWMNPAVPSEWFNVIKENMPAFNPDLTPLTGMSEVTKVFAMQPRAIRSNHPQVSFIAVGKKAEWLMKQHQLSFGLGENSPLQKMYAQGAKILCLGTSYDTVTALHLAEFYANSCVVKQCESAIIKGEKREWVTYDDLTLDTDKFLEIGVAFESNSKVNKIKIGLSECRLLDMQSLVDFGTEYLKKN